MEIFIPNNNTISFVEIPPSKSYAQRALVAAALSYSNSTIINPGKSDDVINMSSAIKSLGAIVEEKENSYSIVGRQNKSGQIIQCGESGLGTRLLASIAPTIGDSFELHGEGSLLKRPMKDLEEFLPKFGVTCKTNNGFLPIHISGKLHGGNVKLDGSKSSQYLSGLLMALPLCIEDSVLEVSNLTSKPYIDITLDVLEKFGIEIENQNYSRFTIRGNQTYKLKEKAFVVEGDYSGAAFWFVAGAISNQKITIQGLQKDSVQADRAILLLLEKVGTKLFWNADILTIEKQIISSFEFDANDCPDLIPALVVLAAACHGTSRIAGANRLKHKESNRAMVLQKEFGGLGLKIEIENDFLIVYGTGKLNSGTIDSHNDHRIAMAGAIASYLTDSGINIKHADAVSKSYPDFWVTFK